MQQRKLTDIFIIVITGISCPVHTDHVIKDAGIAVHHIKAVIGARTTIIRRTFQMQRHRWRRQIERVCAQSLNIILDGRSVFDGYVIVISRHHRTRIIISVNDQTVESIFLAITLLDADIKFDG